MSQNPNSLIAGFVTVMLIVIIFSFGGDIINLLPTVMPPRPSIEEFYWGYRSLDIFVQAFLVFAASIAVASLFRHEEKEQKEENSTTQKIKRRSK